LRSRRQSWLKGSLLPAESRRPFGRGDYADVRRRLASASRARGAIVRRLRARPEGPAFHPSGIAALREAACCSSRQMRVALDRKNVSSEIRDRRPRTPARRRRSQGQRPCGCFPPSPCRDRQSLRGPRSPVKSVSRARRSSTATGAPPAAHAVQDRRFKRDGTITGVHLKTLLDGGAYGLYASPARSTPARCRR